MPLIVVVPVLLIIIDLLIICNVNVIFGARINNYNL